MEWFVGSTKVNWYSILQAMMTQAQTVHTLEAKGRNWLYGSAKAQDAKKT